MRIPLYIVLASVLGAALYYMLAVHPQEAATHRRPNETEWIKRTYPHYAFDEDAYHSAFEQAHLLRTAGKSHELGPWTPVGPTNIPGRISDTAFDPANPVIVYAASASGGVYKSYDTGQTWEPIFDEVPVQTIGDVAIDPANPQTVYVGTGEANGGHNNIPGAGLYKSTDGGSTWTFSGLETTTSIGRVLVDPKDPDRLFVAAVGSYFAPGPNRGVYRSLDAGTRWEQVLFINDSTGVVDLVMRPDSSQILFAAAWQRVRRPNGVRLGGESSGIYRSDDGGDSWTRLGPDTGLPSGEFGRIGLALCRDQPDVMYALYLTDVNYYGFYRSDDGGRTWEDADPKHAIKAGTGGFSWYMGQVRVSPVNPDVVFAMDVLFMKSEDGGLNWTHMVGPHVDYHALAFHPDDPDYLVAGNDGGIAISTDAGETWRGVRDLANTQFYEIGLHPTDPSQFYGGTQDNGTLMNNAPGGWRLIWGGDGFYVVVDPVDPSIIYVESELGILYKLSSSGSTRAMNGIPDAESRNWSTPVVMDPNNRQVLYYGTDRLYRTEDAAESWLRISDVLVQQPALELLGTISTIAVSPSDSNIIYAGTDDGNLWVSSDYGVTWTLVSETLPRRWITRIVVHPTDSHSAYVTYSGLRWRDPQPHIFRTRDLGATWENITANLPDAPVNAFAIDPVNTSYLFAGTDIGAFVSTNGGSSWEVLDDGMPAVSVYDMKIFYDGTSHLLVAGTHGRSMYTLDLSSIVVAVEAEQELPEDLRLAPPFPNPFSHRVTLRYQLPSDGRAQLEVFDVLGRRVSTLMARYLNQGSYAATWQPLGNAPGTYFARLSVITENHTAMRTVALQRW